MSEPVGQGGGAPPDFVRSVNPISTRGQTASPPHFYSPPQIFRPSDITAYPTLLSPAATFLNHWRAKERWLIYCGSCRRTGKLNVSAKFMAVGGILTMLFWWIFLLPALVADGRTLLRSAPQMCPIDNDNLLEVKLFVADGNQCYNLCEENPDCEFFRWGNLFTLMYTYLYRNNGL